MLKLLADLVIQLQELLFGHQVEHFHDGQAIRHDDLIGAKELLACLASQRLLLLVVEGFTANQAFREWQPHFVIVICKLTNNCVLFS